MESTLRFLDRISRLSTRNAQRGILHALGRPAVGAFDNPCVFHKHSDQPADVTLVIDALDMYSFIEDRIEKLSPADVEKIKAVHDHLPKFNNGFDGNNESTLMSIAQFVVKEMDRFVQFKDRDFNSHSPRADRYRRMTQAFEPIRATLDFGRELSTDQTIAIVTA